MTKKKARPKPIDYEKYRYFLKGFPDGNLFRVRRYDGDPLVDPNEFDNGYRTNFGYVHSVGASLAIVDRGFKASVRWWGSDGGMAFGAFFHDVVEVNERTAVAHYDRLRKEVDLRNAAYRTESERRKKP